MKTSFKLLFFLLFAPLLAWADGIQFEHGSSWAEVKAKAKRENKYIFVDAYAEWCGPCKWMSAQVFTSASVGEFFNSKFVSYKFDMEKGEGPEFAGNYNVQAYPTLVFFSPDGEMVHKSVGALDVDPFIDLGKDAMNPEKQLASLTKRFNSGERSADFMNSYITALSTAYEDASSVTNEYLQSIPKAEWKKQEVWSVIRTAIGTAKSPVYQEILGHKADYIAIHGEAEVMEFLQNGIFADLNSIIRSQDAQALAAAKNTLAGILPAEEFPAMSAKIDMYFYSESPQAFEYMSKYLNTYAKEASELNSAAWQLFETTEDTKKLEAALVWADRSIAIEKSSYNLDTKAHLLAKLGRKKEAAKVAKEAIELGKANGEDVSATETLLKSLQ